MKFSGEIGFMVDEEEVRPGIWKPKIVERHYVGDVLRNYRKNETVSNQQNDNINISNQLSIISDIYLQDNWPMIKYVLWKNVKWKVSDIDLDNYPRVTMNLGGVYNGET